MVTLRRSVIIGQQCIPKPRKNVLDEIVDLRVGPMLHNISDDNQIACLVDVPQVFDNTVFPSSSGCPSDLFDHLKPNIGLMF